MRSARDCLLNVRAQEVAAGRSAPGIYAVGEQKWILHSYFYYLRRLWLGSGRRIDDRRARTALFVPGRQRPILIGDADYQVVQGATGRRLRSVPALQAPRNPAADAGTVRHVCAGSRAGLTR